MLNTECCKPLHYKMAVKIMKFNLLTVYVLLTLCSATKYTAFYPIKILNGGQNYEVSLPDCVCTAETVFSYCQCSNKILLKHILEPSTVKYHLFTAFDMQVHVSTSSIYNNGIP